MRIIEDTKLDFKDVLIVPKRSTLNSRSEVSLYREIKFAHNTHKWVGVPIIAANMDTVGTFEMANALIKYSALTCIHKHYSTSDWDKFLSYRSLQSDCQFPQDRIICSVGTREEDFTKLRLISQQFQQHNMEMKFVCIDIANGYSQHLLKFIEQVRTTFPNIILIAGNVVTPEMTEALILAGADIVKVGIGGGSACTTRVKTGVGYPQLSAVIECADAAHGIKGHIISDGGCTNPGDVAKAFGGGADFVMLGGMLAGHDEAGEDNLVYDGVIVKGVRFYGMSSTAAMEKHYGGKATYRASEGKETLVPYKGPVSNTIEDVLGGLRSACTYAGAVTIKELPKRTTFVKVHQQHNPVYDNYVV